jgi:crotonobetaine/carnitine-CoA ligase
MPGREVVVLRHILERQAAERPQAPCVVFQDGSSWTFAHAVDEARRAAAVLYERGLRRGDRALVFLPNGPGWLRAWWGVSWLGAAIVPVNTAYRGDMLRHVCTDADATLIVTEAHRVARLDEVAVPVPVVEVGQLEGPIPSDAGGPDEPVEPWDLAAIMYTSGTTGPSKGVLSPYYQAYCNATLWTPRLGPDERMLIDLPMYHIAGTFPSTAAWTSGASIALADSFSGSTYLERVRALGVTQSLLIGTMPAFLASMPERPDDHLSPWHSVMCAPLPADVDGFCRRFGIDDLWTTFGMTEVSAPFVSRRDGSPILGVGRLRPGYQIRLVDEHDLPVAPDGSGELLIRHEHPWSMNAGYHGHPEATARAWRNGWFHTGDVFSHDEDGNYFFVDRVKDAIRRRGENISSFEVERAVMQHPLVVEAGAVGAPGRFGDEEVKVFVVVSDAGAFDPAELVAFLVPRMPYYMVPRFVEVIDELPVSTNARVQKEALRDRGNSAATWDREAAGIVVGRDHG